MGAPRLELRGIRKAYPAVVANDGIDLAVAPGEIHAVIGENGAGKSTLMKVIYGMVRPDAGDMLWEGREALVRSPADAQRLGIGMVFQHFALFDTLTVAHKGQGCVHQDMSFEWKAPAFANVQLGWESYQQDAERTLYIDDVVIATTRVGCPAP